MGRNKIGKLFCVIALVMMLSGCGVDLSFKTFVQDVLDTSDIYESIDEIIGYIEFEDAKFGVSMAKTFDEEEVLLLSHMYIDESSYFYSSTHGDHMPLAYEIVDHQRIWYEALMDGNIYYYDEDETTNYKYVSGILDGRVDNIAYEGGSLKQALFTFYYLSSDVEITLWAVQLDKNKQFDIDRLQY